jgi:hypothetical protein
VCLPLRFVTLSCLCLVCVLWASIHLSTEQQRGVSRLLQELATWGFGDWVFGQETDWFSNVSMIRRAGFHGQNLDTYEMFARQFDKLRKDKVIPP